MQDTSKLRYAKRVVIQHKSGEGPVIAMELSEWPRSSACSLSHLSLRADLGFRSRRVSLWLSGFDQSRLRGLGETAMSLRC